MSRAEILKELEQRRGTRFQALMRLGDSLRRGWSDQGGEEVLRLPAEAGSLLYVGNDYQVRIYGEGCEGHVTEIRDTQGEWLRPRGLEPDFGVFSDPDTCDGRKVSFGEEMGKLAEAHGLSVRPRPPPDSLHAEF